MDTQVHSFGEFLLKKRKAKGLTQYKLSKHSGVSITHIRRVELGGTSPSPKILKKIGSVLGIPQDEMMQEAGYSQLSPNSSRVTNIQSVAVFLERLSKYPENKIEEIMRGILLLMEAD